VQGLARYGHLEAAARIAAALIDASALFGGRLPELFCGFDRADVPVPVPYPTSCSPQAWAAATPIGLLTALLMLTPDAAGGTVRAAHHLPPEWGHLTLTGISVAGRHTDLDTRRLPGPHPADRRCEVISPAQ
jgi:glycogen debranching enzyme